MSRPLDGYPQPFGYSKGSVFPHAGPSNYTRVTSPSPIAVPVTGGDTVQAIEAGLKAFDHVTGGMTDDGLYEVVAIPGNASNNSPSPTGGFTTYKLIWYIAGTRTQAASHRDLSDSIVRLFALGPK